MAVESVNDTNFKETLSNNPNVIVKYYADWCGSCKLFAPKFKRLSNDEAYSNINFIEVNAEDNPEARHAGNVDSLPFFAIFKDGNLVEGSATSKEEAVVAMLQKLS